MSAASAASAAAMKASRKPPVKAAAGVAPLRSGPSANVAVTSDKAAAARLPRLRRDLRSMTAAIGALCLLDAALRVLIAYTFPLRTAGTLVHFQPIVLVCLLMLLGKSWGARIRRYIPQAR